MSDTAPRTADLIAAETVAEVIAFRISAAKSARATAVKAADYAAIAAAEAAAAACWDLAASLGVDGDMNARIKEIETALRDRQAERDIAAAVSGAPTFPRESSYDTAARACIAAGTERALQLLSIMNTLRDTAADGMPMAADANATYYAQVGHGLYTAETEEDLAAAIAGAWGTETAKLQALVLGSARNLDGYRYTDLG